jgi:SAM-dependent methyltransferase
MALKGVILAFSFMCVLLGCRAAAVRLADPTPEASGTAETISRQTSEPYTGPLDIFEDPKRDENLQIARVMEILGVTEGKNVADIGAGSGWFTVRAARRVAPGGKVFAVEINPDYIKYIVERSGREGLSNVQTVLSKPDDPLLPRAAIDAVLILKTYHEIKEPVILMKNLKASLRPGAKVGIIDKNGNGTDHGLDREKLLEEIRSAGFELVEEYDFVEPDGMDYFLVLRSNDFHDN